MNDNLKNILSNLSTDVDQETLMKYLQGKLSEEQKNEVEKKMLDSNFDDDALEGLQEIKNTGNISSVVEQLNRDLQRRLKKKKLRREQLRFKDQPWLYITIILILLLVVVCYFVIQRLLQNN